MLIYMFIGVIFGMALSVVLFFIWENRKNNNAASKSDKIIKDAEERKEKIIKEAINNSKNLVSEAKKESSQIINKAEKIEERVLEREEKIEKKLEEIELKQEKLFQKENDFSETIAQKENELIEKKEKLKKKKEELDNKLSELSKLSEKQAKKLFLEEISEKYEDDALNIIKKHKKSLENKKKDLAREIILKSIQQYASDVTSEVTTTLIEIPSDEIKGKLIGKEGRNITTFEKMTGVALIIDDTPDTVFISAFDLYKRYIAKKSLEKLIEDGRIQPARIEEVVEATENEAEILLKELGTKILEELNIADIPDEIIPIIGKLRFRTSYGQNILKHSKETALIAESIAKDLGANSKLVKIGALLHDIGKALDQEIEGTHPELGGKLARKYGLQKEIVDMIENHHGEQFEISLEAAIVQVADAISSVRPGARREAIEQYLKRVQEMEALVQSFSGVNKAYALSAGREVRVFVDANNITDLKAQEMAKDIADEIQENLSYPGEVKVNLIREMRVIEYAK
ncbi:ribonuclease Y [Candidatus Gracilibacteria bacterium]|nr:MAG: ribonuclease Y [Candidatus Gracilibacteria bacterium]PIE85715.1 MAG: ribonuclease Y [Candidatus Gracilibacteria bacterium]